MADSHAHKPDHAVSHHANDPVKKDKLVKIQNYHTKVLAKFLTKMANTPDGDGSLLDHSIILYGSNMSNSDRHNQFPLPTAFIGGGSEHQSIFFISVETVTFDDRVDPPTPTSTGIHPPSFSWLCVSMLRRLLRARRTTPLRGCRSPGP